MIVEGVLKSSFLSEVITLADLSHRTYWYMEHDVKITALPFASMYCYRYLKTIYRDVCILIFLNACNHVGHGKTELNWFLLRSLIENLAVQ